MYENKSVITIASVMTLRINKISALTTIRNNMAAINVIDY